MASVASNCVFASLRKTEPEGAERRFYRGGKLHNNERRLRWTMTGAASQQFREEHISRKLTVRRQSVTEW